MYLHYLSLRNTLTFSENLLLQINKRNGSDPLNRDISFRFTAEAFSRWKCTLHLLQFLLRPHIPVLFKERGITMVCFKQMQWPHTFQEQGSCGGLMQWVCTGVSREVFLSFTHSVCVPVRKSVILSHQCYLCFVVCSEVSLHSGRKQFYKKIKKQSSNRQAAMRVISHQPD